MKKTLKWIGIVVGALLLLAVLAGGGLMISTYLKMNATYEITPEPLSIPTDPEALAHGERLVSSLCINCHGEDLGGAIVFEDPSLGYFDGANLTPGEGGKGREYQDADWVRAIRHGVRQDGKSVVVMPANDFFYFSDADLGAIIAYIKTLPPVNRTMRERQFQPLGAILYGAGAFGNLLMASAIPDHSARPAAPAPGVTAEYGGYLVTISGCKTCHGSELAGGKSPAPDAPWAPNLTPGGELLVWTADDFINTIRTGVTPSGHELLDDMPYWEYANFSDDQLTAIFLFLQAQPKLASVVP